MKFLNDFKNIFAVLGIVSIIFWTCASDSTSDDNSSNLPPQLTGGTYQVSITSSVVGTNQNYVTKTMVALNTETGVLKTYTLGSNSIAWSEYDDTITFTH